jgi:hypothetical protein
METEGSSPHPQVLATDRYPEPDQSSPCPHHTSLRSILILIPHLSLGLPIGLFHTDARTIILYAPVPSTIRATCPTSLIYLDVSNIWWAIQTTTLLIKQLPVTSTLWWRAAYVTQKRDTVRNYRRWLHKVFGKTFFVLGPCWRFLQESWRTAWDLWRNVCLKIQCIRESVRCWCVVLYNAVFRWRQVAAPETTVYVIHCTSHFDIQGTVHRDTFL